MTSPNATAGDPPSAAPPLRRLYRASSGRMFGGVAQGLARHFGLPVLWVRAAFVGLALAQGLGVLLYGVFWFTVPLGIEKSAAGGSTAAGGRWRAWRRRRDRGQLAAFVVLIIGVALGIQNMDLGLGGGYLWPLAVAGAGAAIVWRQADDVRRERWLSFGRSGLTGRGGAAVLVRLVIGVALVGAGVIGFLLLHGSVDHFGQVVQAALAVFVGAVLLLGPYLVRMAQDLSAERRERIRAQERAEVAAHVHDSVLHTLTLIQRHSEDPREVQRLARAQERELRRWLYRGDESEDAPSTLSEALRRIAGEVEDAHGAKAEVVCVGDCPLDERVEAMLQAAREALVNAAKYGGDAPVQVFAEVEGRTVSVFVRDRGPGFVMDEVPEDRLGVRESIIGRMRRNGGRGTVRSVPGEGTEVELEMERAQ